MNIVQLVLDKNLKILSNSSVINERLIKKTILELKKYPKKISDDFTYLKNKYLWKKEAFKEYSIVTIVDISEVDYFKKQAWVDELTGVYNRHSYRKLLDSMIAEVIRNKRNLGLVFVDIDNLKLINTTKGYVGGDSAIKQISKIVSQTIRKNDVLVRYGGDEFLVLSDLIDDGFNSLKQMSGRILKNVMRKTRPQQTVSVGGVVLNINQVKEFEKTTDFKKDWRRIIDKMDSLVRKSKTTGKNQYFISRVE